CHTSSGGGVGFARRFGAHTDVCSPKYPSLVPSRNTNMGLLQIVVVLHHKLPTFFLLNKSLLMV
ncbi:hypothetical protein ABN267_11530, partial [Providencia rettgeri]